MTMKKKLLTTLSVVLILGLAALGILAYLTDTDSDVNVMTLGNVDIEQYEYQRVVENGEYKTATIDEQKSYVLEDFEQGKALLPSAINTTTWEGWDWDTTPVRMTQVDSYGGMQVFKSASNAQDKFVVVENTGKTDAYVRTLVAIEVGSGNPALIGTSYHQTWTKTDPAVGTVAIDENNYYVYEYVYAGAKNDDDTWLRHANGVLPAGDTAYPNLSQVYIKSAATNEDCAALDGNGNGTLDILVLSQAVQAEGFADAAEALKAGFGEVNEANVEAWFGRDNNKELSVPGTAATAEELVAALKSGENVSLIKDIKDAPVETKAPYGNNYGVALNGGTLNGNGNVLDFDSPSGDNYGVMTSGGTIKNATITGVFRGIMIMNPTEDIYIDNVTIGDEDVCYAINTGEGNGQHDLIVTNSTIKGWSSYGTAVKSVSFTKCTFAQGEYYTNVFGRLVKPYVDTVFDSCEFNSYFYIDLSQLGKDGDGNVLTPDTKIVLKNCTVNGVKLTAENWKTLIAPEDTCSAGQISIEGKDGSYMSESNIFDYVIIK